MHEGPLALEEGGVLGSERVPDDRDRHGGPRRLRRGREPRRQDIPSRVALVVAYYLQ